MAVLMLSRYGPIKSMCSTAGMVQPRFWKASFQQLFQHYPKVFLPAARCSLSQLTLGMHLKVRLHDQAQWLKCVSRGRQIASSSNKSRIWVRHIPSSGFHTTHKLQIHPIIWIFLKPVAKLGAILSGR